jgi:hypothetical protein
MLESGEYATVRDLAKAEVINESMDRRAFIRIGATASVAAAGGVAPVVGPASAAEEAPKASGAAKDVTKSLANYVVKTRFEDLPDRVRKEVGRSLLNWMGVTVGGSRHRTVDIAIAAVQPFAGPQQASLFGRKERLDIMNALPNIAVAKLIAFTEVSVSVPANWRSQRHKLSVPTGTRAHGLQRIPSTRAQIYR